MLRLSLTLDSVILQTPVRVEAALPQSSFMRGDRLKTLWCLHPAFSDGAQMLERLNLADVADSLGMAVICPSLQNGYFISSDIAPIGDFLESELYTCMPNLLPLSRDRDDNECLGISMGAYGALSWVLRKPGNFHRVYCVSGYYDRDLAHDPRLRQQRRSWQLAKLVEPHFMKVAYDRDGKMRADADLKKLLSGLEDPGALPEIGFICGDRDYLSCNQTEAMYDLVKEAGVKTTLRTVHDGEHDISCWRQAVALILKDQAR